MGVDIWGYAEVSHGDRWEFVGEMVSNPECVYDPDEPDLMPAPLFHSFNRELAAILANYDNTIRASVPYIPVVLPRGLPSDLSAELECWFRRQEGDPCLATNWFTKRELDAFGWEDRIMAGGRWSSLASQDCLTVAHGDSRWRTGRRVSESVMPAGSGTASWSSGWNPTPRSSPSFTEVSCPGSRPWAHPIRFGL